MSDTGKDKINQEFNQPETLVIEFETSAWRAAQMAFDDRPVEGQARPLLAIPKTFIKSLSKEQLDGLSTQQKILLMEMRRDTENRNLQGGSNESSTRETARFRVVVFPLGSVVEVYFRNTDIVGDACWSPLIEGESLRLFTTGRLRRSLIIAEAFRRLATDGPRSITEVSTRARVVDLGVE